MRFRKPSSLRTVLLLCLVVIGPLQAQIAFACEMMDAVVHEECCCDGPAAATDCLHAERGASAQAETKACCEVSVAINIDQDARQHSPTFKPPDQHVEIEPPIALIAAFDEFFLTARSPAPYARAFDRALPHPGSDTYLITRRLRI